MKKFFSFFMTAVMVMTLLPMTAFADTYPKAELVGSPAAFTTDDKNAEVRFKVALGKNLDLKAGRVMLQLDNAKLASAPAPASVTVVQGSTSTTSPTVAFKTPEGNALTGGEKMFNLEVASDIKANNVDETDVIVTLKLDFSASELKDAKVTLNDYGTGIGTATLVVGKEKSETLKDFEITIDKPGTAIGPAGGMLSKVVISRLDKLSSNKAENEIVVDLPSGYLFSTSTKVTASGATPTVSYSRDKNEMTITGIDNKAAYITIEPFVILEANNSASAGNIMAGFNFKVNGKSVESKDLLIGKLQSYGLTLTAKEQGMKEIPNLSKGVAKTVELTIKAVDGTLTNGAVINLDVKNAEIVYNTIKVVEPTGLILTAPKSAGANNKVSGYEVYNDSEFSLRTNKFDIQNIKVTFDVVAAEKATGNATVTAGVTRMDDVTIDIAKISKVLELSITPAKVEKGTKPALPNVVIKETDKNLLQKGDKLYLELVYPGSERDKGQHIAYEAVKDIKVATTNSLKVDAVELDKQENILILTIGSRSYEGPGTITLSNIKGYLTEKATMNQVDLQVKLNNSIEASAPFFSVSNPVAIKTVFVINNLSYTAGGQVKQLVTAPYIKDGRTMLPVRAVGESLGLEASWDHATKTATFKNAEKTAIVKIGQSTITVNNTPMPLTVPAEIKNGSTMIELRSLATAFGVSIAWDAVNKSVTVN